MVEFNSNDNPPRIHGGSQGARVDPSLCRECSGTGKRQPRDVAAEIEADQRDPHVPMRVRVYEMAAALVETAASARAVDVTVSLGVPIGKSPAPLWADDVVKAAQHTALRRHEKAQGQAQRFWACVAGVLMLAERGNAGAREDIAKHFA